MLRSTISSGLIYPTRGLLHATGAERYALFPETEYFFRARRESVNPDIFIES